MRFVIFCLICVLGLSTAHAEKYFWIRAFKEGDKYEGSVIVKPLDDPANPYKDQYTAYDTWCVEHYNRHINIDNHVEWQMGLDEAQGSAYLAKNGYDSSNYPRWDPSRALTLSYTRVDKDGYIVPQLWRDPAWNTKPWIPTIREALEDIGKPWVPEPAGFWSLGFVDPAIYTQNDIENDASWATSYPPVAQWIVAQNKDTVLLPDGGAIFISDALNAPPGLASQYPSGKFYVQWFASAGTMKKDMLVSSRQGWNRILSDKKMNNEYLRKYEGTSSSGETYTYNNIHGLGGRYTVYKDKENGGALAVIDYWQDKIVTPTSDGPDFLDKLTVDWRYFQDIDAQTLARVYLAQQESAAK